MSGSYAEILMDTEPRESSGSDEKTPGYVKLLENGVPIQIAAKLDIMFQAGKILFEDLDERAFLALKELPKEDALVVLNQFVNTNFEHVSNKSAFLCGMMKALRQKQKVPGNVPSLMPENVPSCVPGNIASPLPRNIPSVASGNIPSLSPGNIAPAVTGNIPSSVPENIPSVTPRNIPSLAPGNIAPPLLGNISAVAPEHSALHGSENIQLKGPDEERIRRILQRTGYSLDVTLGQRKYGGPPPGWQGPHPGKGCEVYCGNIPHDVFEDELIPLFENYGKIFDLRVMMEPTNGLSKGFAFITFTSAESAQNAVKDLDKREMRPGKILKVNITFPNLRLFIGNIPKTKDKDDIMEEFGKFTVGLVNAIVYPSPDERWKNRGFCFLEYESHKAASIAKKRLSSRPIRVWKCDILVDWADPQEEPNEEIMSRVKILYVRNLKSEFTEERLRDQFEQFGPVFRVKKLRDYAFIHFDQREHAIVAMNELNGKEFFDNKMEISLAKPPTDKRRREELLRNREKRMGQMLSSRGIGAQRHGPRGDPRGGFPRGPAPANSGTGSHDASYDEDYGYADSLYGGPYSYGGSAYYDEDYGYGGGEYGGFYSYGGGAYYDEYYRAYQPPLMAVASMILPMGDARILPMAGAGTSGMAVMRLPIAGTGTSGMAGMTNGMTGIVPQPMGGCGLARGGNTTGRSLRGIEPQ